MRSVSKDAFVASMSPTALQPEFRLLLDQGFPKPTGFAISELDQSVSVVHLSDFEPALAENSTPDWFLYCRAAEAGFHAFVARDKAQLDQLAEMYVLSRLKSLAVVTWRKGIDDPVREWGQLLAYLPEVRKRVAEAGGRAILLPNPTLRQDNYHDPLKTLSEEARQLGISVREARLNAYREIADWLGMTGDSADRFDELLGHP